MYDEIPQYLAAIFIQIARVLLHFGQFHQFLLLMSDFDHFLSSSFTFSDCSSPATFYDQKL